MKLSCKDVCFMVSESHDRKLSLRERISVKTHLLMCNACKCMVRQLEALRAASQQRQTLSKEARTRILARLRDRADNHHNGE